MKNNTNLIAGLLSGAAIGLALGVLYAPEKGVETRKKIKAKANDAKASVVAKAADVKGSIVSKTQDLQNQISARLKTGSTVEDEINHVVASVGKNTDEVITAMENKLAELKKKNRKVTMN